MYSMIAKMNKAELKAAVDRLVSIPNAGVSAFVPEVLTERRLGTQTGWGNGCRRDAEPLLSAIKYNTKV